MDKAMEYDVVETSPGTWRISVGFQGNVEMLKGPCELPKGTTFTPFPQFTSKEQAEGWLKDNGFIWA